MGLARRRALALASGMALIVGTAGMALASGLDRGFGQRGIVAGSFPEPDGDPAAASMGQSVTVDGQGRIVLAGAVTLPSGQGAGDIGVARYSADGTLDPSFSGDGTTLVDIPAPEDVSRFWPAQDVGVSADGSVVIAGELATGQSSSDVAVVRLTPTGEVDRSFGSDGIVRFDIGRVDSVADVMVDSKDEAWIAGDAGERLDGTGSDPFAARLTVRGAPDPTFGGDGISVVELDGEQKVTDAYLVREANLRITGVQGKSSLLLFGLDRTGGLDPEFARGGRTADRGSRYVAPVEMLQASDDLVLVASGGTRIRLRAFDAAGDLDRSFGDRGLARASLEGRGSVAGIGARHDGIYVGGSLRATERRRAELARRYPHEPLIFDERFLVTRFTYDGGLDGRFAGNGKAVAGTSGPVNAVTDFVQDRQGRVILSSTEASIDESFEIESSGYRIARFRRSP